MIGIILAALGTANTPNSAEVVLNSSAAVQRYVQCLYVPTQFPWPKKARIRYQAFSASRLKTCAQLRVAAISDLKTQPYTVPAWYKPEPREGYGIADYMVMRIEVIDNIFRRNAEWRPNGLPVGTPFERCYQSQGLEGAGCP